jgi:hypothetical protein
MPHLALIVHTLQTMQVWSKYVYNEGQFILGAEVVFRPYVAFLWNDLTQKTHQPLTAHSVQTVQDWSKSVDNEEHFTWKP